MLLDHFHPPLSLSRPWSSLHATWAVTLSSAINERLPEGWFAGPHVKWAIEVDVATFDIDGGPWSRDGQSGTAPLPAPTETVAFELQQDTVAVHVYQEIGELRLAGVIELVSPGHKDRAAARESFTAKCDSLLREACGLIIIDIVTDRHANLHRELLRRIDPNHQSFAEIDSPLYHVAYRPFRDGDRTRLSYWHRRLAVGRPIDDTLLFLKEGPVVEVPIAGSYAEVLRRMRL